jgi:uncharacterized phage protein gp47/JayE
MGISSLVYVDATGYYYADYPTFLAFETQAYKNIYGTDVYLGADSQDGQLIAARAQANYDTAALGAVIYNSMSVAGAQGAGLARLVKLNGVKKQLPTNSTVDLTIGGTVGTNIANGIATDSLNQQWLLPASVTIPSAGTIIATAMALNPGAVAAQANTITTIFTPTRGWQTVNNVSAATLGVALETDASLRTRQGNSTAIPSQTVFDGTKGAVANVTGVTASRGYENATPSTDGNGIPRNSIAMIVAGGDAMAIAQAIQIHKTPGTGTYGTTTEVVYDSHGMPLNIAFSRPTQVEITAAITLKALTGYSSVYTALIQQAAVDFINANGIGNNVLVTKLMVAINLVGTAYGATFDILTLAIARYPATPAFANVTIAYNEIAEATLTDVTITVT